MDTTRILGRTIQQGVRDARMWKYGPIEFQAVTFSYGKSWTMGLWIGRFGVAFQFNRHGND